MTVKRMRNATVGERLSANSRRDGNCVVWVGANNTKWGYGRIRINGRKVMVHRAAWELANGPIADGMVLDHICENTKCIKVEHLRLVTLGANSARKRRSKVSRVGYMGVHFDGYAYRAVWQEGGSPKTRAFATIPEAVVHVASKRLENYPIKEVRDMKMVELFGPIMLSDLSELEQPYTVSVTQNEKESPNDQ